ncbi:hypothetical protein Tco_1007579 [Tanacetum coccineum]
MSEVERLLEVKRLFKTEKKRLGVRRIIYKREETIRIETIIASGPTDTYFTRVTQTIESTFSLSPRQMALWQSQMEDHTSDWLRVVPISEEKLKLVLMEGLDKPLRPADMLLYLWGRGLDMCVDLTGSSPLTQTGLADFVPGRAVMDAAHCKRVKYEAKCADIGYSFLPFLFSSLGELEKDAVALLKRIRKFFVTQDIGARTAVHIFNRISFAIAKGVGAQIVSRLSH